jgi:hypothetical protein
MITCYMHTFGTADCNYPLHEAIIFKLENVIYFIYTLVTPQKNEFFIF